MKMKIRFKDGEEILASCPNCHKKKKIYGNFGHHLMGVFACDFCKNWLRWHFYPCRRRMIIQLIEHESGERMEKKTIKPKIFVSYNPNDESMQSTALRVQTLLSLYGVTCQLPDRFGAKIGEIKESTIERINASDYFFALCGEKPSKTIKAEIRKFSQDKCLILFCNADLSFERLDLSLCDSITLHTGKLYSKVKNSEHFYTVQAVTILLLGLVKLAQINDTKKLVKNYSKCPHCGTAHDMSKNEASCGDFSCPDCGRGYEWKHYGKGNYTTKKINYKKRYLSLKEKQQKSGNF